MKTFERLRFFLIIGASTRRSSTDGCQYFLLTSPILKKKNIKQMKIEKGACRFDALGSVQQHLIVPQRFHHHPSICTFTVISVPTSETLERLSKLPAPVGSFDWLPLISNRFDYQIGRVHVFESELCASDDHIEICALPDAIQSKTGTKTGY